MRSGSDSDKVLNLFGTDGIRQLALQHEDPKDKEPLLGLKYVAIEIPGECLTNQIPEVLNFFAKLVDTHTFISGKADMWNVTTYYRREDPVAFVSSSKKGEYYIYDPRGNSTLSDVSAILRSIKCDADIPGAALQMQHYQEKLSKIFFVYRIPFFQKLPCLLALFFSAIALSWKISCSWEPKGAMETIGLFLLNLLHFIVVVLSLPFFAVELVPGDLYVRELGLIINARNIRRLTPKLKTGYKTAIRFFKEFEELEEPQNQNLRTVGAVYCVLESNQKLTSR